MARIAGVDLPRDKKIQYALPYIFGIGPNNAKKILAETGVSADARVRDLRDAEVARLRDRKSTRLNSSHRCISYAVFCLKKKKRRQNIRRRITIALTLSNLKLRTPLTRPA